MTEREKLPENVVMISAKSIKKQIDGKDRWEYDTSDEKYVLTITNLLDKHDTVILKGRGKAIQRCVRFATHKLLIDKMDKPVVEISVEEKEEEGERGTYMKRVEQIEITLAKKK